ncbi:hypothetical protein PCK2_000911, partial [Pneumocystis canis]
MLKKRDPEVKEEMGEEHFLALILKENTEKNKCEKELGKYCQSLKDAELESEKVHEKLKDVCEKGNVKDKDKKCKDLKNKIEGKCPEVKKELEEVLKERPIKNENCEKYEHQCLFLEGACQSDLTEKCSELRNRCYSMKRMNVAREVLVRALKGELKDKDNQCKEKLKEHCVHLASMSRELLWRCLNVEETCENLVNVTKKKCASLKTKVEKVENVEKDKCHSLLEECHFYGANCQGEDIQNKCNELKTQCEDEYDIMYTPPEGPFIPIYPRVSIIEKVGLKELYQEMAKKGILIEKISFAIEDLILFLSQKEEGKFDETLCEKAFENCEYFKKLTRHLNYNCE